MNEGEKVKPQEVKVVFPDTLKGGAYSNNLSIAHTREEFILDFILVAPRAGAVTSRVIISPGHMKRILKALSVNLGKYEKNFGQIKIAEEPQAKGKLGFRAD